MSALGKLSPAALERVVLAHLGAARPEVLVGPKSGVDCAIVRAGPARVMAVTSDPLSILPRLGFEDSARLACHLLATDAWTSGIPPAFATVDLHLPPSITDDELERFTRAMGEEWARLGVAVIGGHTGRYDGCDYTVVGAGTLIGGDARSPVGPCFPSDIVVSRRTAGTRLAPQSAQKIVPSNCLDWQLLQTCIVVSR